MDEKIKKLLTSELEGDRELGWELIRAKSTPYQDVIDFITEYKSEKGYFWYSNGKFVYQEPNYIWNLPLTTSSVGATLWNQSITFSNPYIYDEIQEKEGLDKSRKVLRHLKNAARKRRRLSGR